MNTDPLNEAIQARQKRMMAATQAALDAEKARGPEEQAAFEGGVTARLIDAATGEDVGIAEGVQDLSAAPAGFRFEAVDD